MNTDHGAVIDELLAEVPEVIVSQEGMDFQDQISLKLAALPAEYSDALKEKSEAFLADLGANNHALKLETLLGAMLKRKQDITDLASRAIFAPGLAEREIFVDLLVVASPETAAEPLTKALRAFDDDSDPDGFLRERIIKRLDKIEARGAALDIISTLMNADADRVRIQAVNTLGNLDARSAKDVLIECIKTDNHPDVVAEAVRVLGVWNVKAARGTIEELASSEWASRSSEVRDATAFALEKLGEANG